MPENQGEFTKEVMCKFNQNVVCYTEREYKKERGDGMLASYTVTRRKKECYDCGFCPSIERMRKKEIRRKINEV